MGMKMRARSRMKNWMLRKKLRRQAVDLMTDKQMKKPVRAEGAGSSWISSIRK